MSRLFGNADSEIPLLNLAGLLHYLSDRHVRWSEGVFG